METENRYSETDLGNISPNPRGEYDPKEPYEYLDLVSYQGGSYLCLAELETTITGTAPDPGRNTEFWQMLTLPGNLTPEYTAMHDNVANKATQVEISRVAVEQAQQEVEASQADMQQLHEDTVQAAQEAENSRDSAAGYAQSAEASRKAAAESEQNINAQMTGLDQKVSESVSKATGDIATARQQAIDTITTQEAKSTAEVKRIGTAALDSAKQASQDIKTAGQQAVRAITDQQNASVQAVKDETKSYIEEKKQEISDKTDEVTQAVEQAGEKQLQNIANSLDNTLTESGKAADSKAVGDAIALIEENKASKSALATTDRKLDALWKLNQGISYEFQTDNAEAYQKEIPTGAKMASVKSIGGKTIVWNQLNMNKTKNQTAKGIAFVNNLDGSWTANGTAIDKAEIETNEGMYALSLIAKHKYLIRGCPKDGSLTSYMIGLWWSSSLKLAVDTGKGTICETTDTTNSAGLFITIINGTTADNLVFRPQLFDLTKMFGLGNEPSTVEEFEAMFPADYYPYNKGTLLSMPVNEVVEQGKNLFDPQILNNFPDECKIEEDGSITTWNNTSNYVYPMSEYVIELEAGTYMMSVTGDIPFTIYLQKDDSDYSTNVTGNVKNRQFTVDKKTSFRVMLSLESNMPVTNFKLQIEKDLIATSYSSYHKREYQIPQAILDLPGYDWSAGDICNEVDWENKKYIQRVAAVDLGSLEWIIGASNVSEKYTMRSEILRTAKKNTASSECSNIITSLYTSQTGDDSYSRKEGIGLLTTGRLSVYDENYSNADSSTIFRQSLQGVDLYYELAKPIVINIAEIIPEGFLEAMEVEAGGSLTFQNSNGDGYKVPVPNTVEYAVKLSEVAE